METVRHFGSVDEPSSSKSSELEDSTPTANSGPGLVGSYWDKLVRRNASSIQQVGVALIFLIGAIVLSVLFYLGALKNSKGLAGLSRNDGTSDLKNARLQKLEARMEKTNSIDAVRAENEVLSALNEDLVMLALAPLKWSEWLLPLLGFIGTVIGISGSIDSLQIGIRLAFANGVISNESLAHLNEGFAGMGVAFDTTFFGLIGFAFVGTLDVFYRRRATNFIREIDEACISKIASYIEPHAPDWKRIMEIVDRVQAWIQDGAGEAIERELTESPEFRRWMREQFPELLGSMADRSVEAVDESLKEVRRGISGAVTRYGELLVRLGIIETQDLRTLRRLAHFTLVSTTDAAAQLPEDPFWQCFAEAMKQPLISTPEMHLVQSDSEQGIVDAIALSGPPYSLAVAIRDPIAGASSIRLHPLGMNPGDSIDLNPIGGNDVEAAVQALALSPRDGRLAYILSDGTLGVYEAADREFHQLIVNGSAASPKCLSWTHGNAGLALCIERAGKYELRIIAVQSLGAADEMFFEDELNGGARILLPDLEPSVVATSERSKLIAVGGMSANTPTIVFYRHIGDTLTLQRELTFEGRQSLTSLSFSGSRHDGVLTAFEDGTVLEIGLGPEKSTTRCHVQIPGVGTPIAIGADLERGMIALARADCDHLTVSTPEGPSEIPGYGPFACAAASPDLRLVAVGGSDGHVAFWEVPVHLTH